MTIRWRNRGFVGPRYSGVRGQLRFLWQFLVVRTDAIMVAEPDLGVPSAEAAGGLVIRWCHSWEDLAPHVPAIDAEFHKGYCERWRPIFGWGERLMLAIEDGHVVAFRWMQAGSDTGFLTHYGVLLAGEARIVRGGVLPSARARGVSTRFHIRILNELFAKGVRRVYIESTVDNLFSVRSQLSAGYRPVGAIRALGWLFGDRGVVWTPCRFPTSLTRPDSLAG